MENLCFDYDEYFPLLLSTTKKKIVYGETPLKFFVFVHRAVNVRDEKGVIMFFFSLSFNITLQTVEKKFFSIYKRCARKSTTNTKLFAQHLDKKSARFVETTIESDGNKRNTHTHTNRF